MSSQPNQGLIDGLACLTELCSTSEPIGGREVARRLGLHHAKANRLLMTLAELGYVRQDDKRRYLPDAGLHVLAALAGNGSGLLQRAQPLLKHLHQTMSDVTLSVGVLWGDQVAYLYHSGPSAPTVESLRLPGLRPVATSSIGQALSPAPGASPRPAALVHDNQQGGQHRSIAVPLYEFGKPVAGLAATTVPMDRDPHQVISQLQQAADEFSMGKTE